MMRYFIIWVVLMLALAGCAPSGQLFGQATPTIPAGAMLFGDDFSSGNSRWGLWESESGGVSYWQGGLRLQVKAPERDFWTVAGQRFADVRIESDARRIGGAPDNAMGLICRYQDARNFYMFLVSSDGYYGIAKVKESQHSLISAEQLQYSGSIQPEQLSHHLRVECIGQALRLYVDDALLAEAYDADFASGDVGVLAGAYSTPGVEILFDNFEVFNP